MKKTTVNLTFLALLAGCLFCAGCSKPDSLTYIVHYYNWSPYLAHMYQDPEKCDESNKVPSNGTRNENGLIDNHINYIGGDGYDPRERTFCVGMNGQTILTLNYTLDFASSNWEITPIISIYYDGKKMWYTD